MSESLHDTLTALRRSKRNKFHLDVAAVFSGSSNPDRRRTTLDAKYISKEANHAVAGKSTGKNTSSEPSLSDLPFLDTEQNEENIEKELCEPVDYRQSPSSKQSRTSISSIDVEPQAIIETRDLHKGEPSLVKPQLNGISVDCKDQRTSTSPKNHIDLPFICDKCGVSLKSKSGLISHSKFCDTNSGRRKRKRRKLEQEKSKAVSSASINVSHNHPSEHDTIISNETNGFMPVLTPEGAQFDPASKKPKSINTSLRLLPEDSQQSINVVSLKKLNLPALPSPLLRPLSSSQCKEFYCCECPYKSTDDTLFRIHRAMHTGERSHKCSVCSFSCFSPESLYSHLDIHLVSNQCMVEKKRITKRKEVESIPLNSTNVIRCSQCSFRTLHGDRFRQHRIDHVQSQRQRLVSIIKRSSNNSYGLEEPVSTLIGPNPKIQFCKKCDFQIEGSDALAHHMEYHGSGQLYRCSLCNYASDEKTVRDFHEKHHHTVEPLSNHVRSLAAALIDIKGHDIKSQLINNRWKRKYTGQSLAVQSLIKALE